MVLLLPLVSLQQCTPLTSLSLSPCPQWVGCSDQVPCILKRPLALPKAQDDGPGPVPALEKISWASLSLCWCLYHAHQYVMEGLPCHTRAHRGLGCILPFTHPRPPGAEWGLLAGGFCLGFVARAWVCCLQTTRQLIQCLNSPADTLACSIVLNFCSEMLFWFMLALFYLSQDDFSSFVLCRMKTSKSTACPPCVYLERFKGGKRTLYPAHPRRASPWSSFPIDCDHIVSSDTP